MAFAVRAQLPAARVVPARLRASAGKAAARPSLRARAAEKEAVTFSFEEKKEAPVEAAAPVAEAPAAPAAPPPAPAGPGFFELMSFNGRPETINSRAAMVAFVAAVGAETSSRHPDVIHQFASPGGFVSFLFVAALVTAGTFMPEILSSARSDYAGFSDSKISWTSDPKTKEFGPFSASAELTNGRAAMMGLVSLMAVESVTHTALFGFL